jgi:hypothetical protein
MGPQPRTEGTRRMNEEIQLESGGVCLSVEPLFASEVSEAAFPEPIALPFGAYRMDDGLLLSTSPPTASPTDPVAMVTLMPTVEGGRRGPPPRDQWRCVLVTPAWSLDARLSFNPSSSIDPGETTPARIRLLSPDLVTTHLMLGTEFEIWEGKIVGCGRVFMHV